MATWDYRIIKHVGTQGETWLTINRVNYDEKGNPQSYAQEPARLAGTSEEEIKDDLQLIGQAFEKPAIEGKDLQTDEWP